MTRCFLVGLVVAGISGMMLIGCGRKGRLEPSSTLLIKDKKGEMVKKPRPDRLFILDPLIAHSKLG
ncbi:MAG: hypothetical protein JSC189_001007 [Candidatus Tokpelaia sp. JSC189]|nr:MAG: hypothetical protein JSC189_001007 [Candidatus Tokpelaia sp. JSC189]